MSSLDDALSVLNTGLAQPPPANAGAPPAAAPSSFDQSLSILQSPEASAPSSMPMPVPTYPSRPSGVAAGMGEGWLDVLAAGAQGTRPDVKGMPAYGYPGYTAAPAPDQWTYQESGLVPHGDTQVVLRDPDTGEQKVYMRNPAMEESADLGYGIRPNLPALGRALGYGIPEPGIPAVAIPRAVTAAQMLAQDFARSGVDPTIPVLAQGPASGYAASVMSKLPGFSGPIVRGMQRTAAQTGASADRTAALFGSAGSQNISEAAEEGGAAAQTGIKSFDKGEAPAGMSAADIIASPTKASSFAAKSGALYDRFWDQMDPSIQIPLENTLEALKGPIERFPSNPSLGQQITNSNLQSLYQKAASNGGTLTVPELKEFRSFIGRAMGEPALAGGNDIPRGDLSDVYRGMSQDLEGAAAAQGPQASRAFEAANSYYNAGKGRIDQLEPLLSGSPEQTFAAINRAAGQGPSANAGLLRSLQRSLPDADWGNVGAAVLRKMGVPTPGVGPQDAFSPASFVTNWNKLSDAAKDTLFGAQGTDQRDGIEALTRVAGAQKAMTRFGNPSGTAHMGATLGEVGVGVTALENREALLAHPIMTTLAIAGGYAAPRLLMNPSIARWLYQMPSTINRAPTVQAGIQRVLGGLDNVVRSDQGLAPFAAQMRQSVAPAASVPQPQRPELRP